MNRKNYNYNNTIKIKEIVFKAIFDTKCNLENIVCPSDNSGDGILIFYYKGFQIVDVKFVESTKNGGRKIKINPTIKCYSRNSNHTMRMKYKRLIRK